MTAYTLQQGVSGPRRARRSNHHAKTETLTRRWLNDVPSVSAIPRSECDKWAGNGRAWLPKTSSPALDVAQKPYHSVSRNPHVSAVFTTALLGLAPARSTRASAANHR